MKPNSIETLYQRIYIRKETVGSQEVEQLTSEIGYFINSQLLNREVDQENEMYDFLFEACYSVVLEAMSICSQKDIPLMPYLTKVIHNTVSSNFRKQYNSSNQLIKCTSLDKEILSKKGERNVCDLPDEHADFEAASLRCISHKKLLDEIALEYRDHREFHWIVKESQGWTDKEIAKHEKISNSYVGRQRKKLKQEIKRKYSKDFHDI